MANSVLKLPDPAAIGAGETCLAHIDLVSAAPSSASDFALHVADVLPSVIARARVAQDDLSVTVATVTELTERHKQKLAAAQAEEKGVDGSFSAVNDTLSAARKAGSADAEILAAFLFSGSASPIRKPRLRAQVRKYRAWLLQSDSATARSNPAYSVIAAAVEEFRARFLAFAVTVEEKESLGASLAAARTARDEARASWDATFTELIGAAAQVHGEQSDAFRAWIKPVQDLKAAQAAARTRRAGAADEPAPDGSG